MSTTEVTMPACARLVGRAIRKIVKDREIPGKVIKCRKVSFAGFGYGDTVVVELELTERISHPICMELHEELKRIRALPYDEGGGISMIQLSGKHYPFGGTIGSKKTPVKF